MRTLRFTLPLLTLLAAPAALAQVEVRVGLPSITFAVRPPVVVVVDDVHVVEDCDDEVFFVGGVYWTRWHDRWYRTHDHRGGWTLVETRYVPVRLVHFEPGRYKHYKRGKHDKHDVVYARGDEGRGERTVHVVHHVDDDHGGKHKHKGGKGHGGGGKGKGGKH